MRLGSCRGWHVKHGDARTQGLWYVVKDVIHTHRYLHLIIEGLNHRQVAQYILWQLAAEVGIVALAVYRESVLHIEFLLTHVACREGGAQSVVLLVVLIVKACRGSMRRSGVHLDAIRLAHVHVAVSGNFFRKKIEGVWRIYDMQYNFEYTNLAKQNLIGLETIMRWHFLNHFTMNATYSYVNVSKTDGIQVNTTSPHAATASIDYKYNKKNYRLGATFSASYMGEKKFDVQDRLSVNGESHDAYFRCQLPQYVLCNLSVIQTFYNKVKVTVGVDNIFNYVPKTLGSGITMFNVPATAGAKAHVQVEVLVDELVKAFRKKK